MTGLVAKRAIIYVRISRDRVGGGLGVERQRKDCEELAERLGWAVVAVYTDNDLSAYSGKPRPGYLAMLDRLRAEGADAVLCWHTDRLHRSPAELEQYITVCESADVPTVTVKAGIIDLATPSGRLIARQMGAVARYEVEHAIERMQSARTQLAARGGYNGGRRPFGFEADGVTVRPEEAEEIVEAAEAVLAGKSLGSIARDLNARGVTTSTGEAWDNTNLHRMLARARNAGIRVHKGDEVGAAEWPAVVSEDRWRAVCAVLRDPSRRTSPGPERRWLGSGLYVCGIHEMPSMRATSKQSRKQDALRPVYACSKAKHLVRDARRLDAFVEALIVTRLSRADAVDLLLDSGRPDFRAISDEALAVRARMAEIADSFGEGAMTRVQFEIANVKAKDRLAVLESKMTYVDVPAVLRDLVEADDAHAVWTGLDISRQRTVLGVLLDFTVLPVTTRGRPPGWRSGEPYFDDRAVRWDWKR